MGLLTDLLGDGNGTYARAKTNNRFPGAVGQIYNGNGPEAAGTRTTGTVLNSVVAGGPLFAAEDIGIDQFSVNIATAAASAVYRMGIWTVDDPDDPFAWTSGVQYATLLSDVGTADASTTGIKTITPATAVAVPAGTWFVVGGVAQVALAQPIIATGAPWSPLGGSNTGGGVGGQGGFLLQSGVSGALGNLTPTSNANIGHGVGFRRGN